MSQNNVKGTYGNINDTGVPFVPAKIYRIDEPNLMDNIEEGIKPLVKALIDLDYPTFSSCEGHFYDIDAVETLNLISDFEYARCVINSNTVENAQKLIDVVKSFNHKFVNINIIDESYGGNFNCIIKEGYDIQIMFTLFVLPIPQNRDYINGIIQKLADYIIAAFK